jgi:hypothetical protein
LMAEEVEDVCGPSDRTPFMGPPAVRVVGR